MTAPEPINRMAVSDRRVIAAKARKAPGGVSAIGPRRNKMSNSMRTLGAALFIGMVAAYPAAAANMAFRYNGPWESPQQNNARSARYDHLLQVSPGFRAYRVRKECNPIDFIQELRQDCVASFDRFEPMLAYGQ
jgi:hypothetical protein